MKKKEVLLTAIYIYIHLSIFYTYDCVSHTSRKAPKVAAKVFSQGITRSHRSRPGWGSFGTVPKRPHNFIENHTAIEEQQDTFTPTRELSNLTTYKTFGEYVTAVSDGVYDSQHVQSQDNAVKRGKDIDRRKDDDQGYDKAFSQNRHRSSKSRMIDRSKITVDETHSQSINPAVCDRAINKDRFGLSICGPHKRHDAGKNVEQGVGKSNLDKPDASSDFTGDKKDLKANNDYKTLLQKAIAETKIKDSIERDDMNPHGDCSNKIDNKTAGDIIEQVIKTNPDAANMLKFNLVSGSGGCAKNTIASQKDGKVTDSESNDVKHDSKGNVTNGDVKFDIDMDVNITDNGKISYGVNDIRYKDMKSTNQTEFTDKDKNGKSNEMADDNKPGSDSKTNITSAEDKKTVEEGLKIMSDINSESNTENKTNNRHNLNRDPESESLDKIEKMLKNMRTEPKLDSETDSLNNIEALLRDMKTNMSRIGKKVDSNMKTVHSILDSEDTVSNMTTLRNQTKAKEDGKLPIHLHADDKDENESPILEIKPVESHLKGKSDDDDENDNLNGTDNLNSTEVTVVHAKDKSHLKKEPVSKHTDKTVFDDDAEAFAELNGGHIFRNAPEAEDSSISVVKNKANNCTKNDRKDCSSRYTDSSTKPLSFPGHVSAHKEVKGNDSVNINIFVVDDAKNNVFYDEGVTGPAGKNATVSSNKLVANSKLGSTSATLTRLKNEEASKNAMSKLLSSINEMNENRNSSNATFSDALSQMKNSHSTLSSSEKEKADIMMTEEEKEKESTLNNTKEESPNENNSLLNSKISNELRKEDEEKAKDTKASFEKWKNKNGIHEPNQTKEVTFVNRTGEYIIKTLGHLINRTVGGARDDTVIIQSKNQDALNAIDNAITFMMETYNKNHSIPKNQQNQQKELEKEKEVEGNSSQESVFGPALYSKMEGLIEHHKPARLDENVVNLLNTTGYTEVYDSNLKNLKMEGMVQAPKYEKNDDHGAKEFGKSSPHSSASNVKTNTDSSADYVYNAGNITESNESDLKTIKEKIDKEGKANEKEDQGTDAHFEDGISSTVKNKNDNADQSNGKTMTKKKEGQLPHNDKTEKSSKTEVKHRLGTAAGNEKLPTKEPFRVSVKETNDDDPDMEPGRHYAVKTSPEPGVPADVSDGVTMYYSVGTLKQCKSRCGRGMCDVVPPPNILAMLIGNNDTKLEDMAAICVSRRIYDIGSVCSEINEHDTVRNILSARKFISEPDHAYIMDQPGHAHLIQLVSMYGGFFLDYNDRSKGTYLTKHLDAFSKLIDQNKNYLTLLTRNYCKKQMRSISREIENLIVNTKGKERRTVHKQMFNLIKRRLQGLGLGLDDDEDEHWFDALQCQIENQDVLFRPSPLKRHFVLFHAKRS